MVRSLLLRNNPNCFIVTGRPRTPRDQGSVESANKTVSAIRKNIACERRRAGLDDNWTQYLGQIMACCNSHAGRARQSVSNYEAVFGMKYHTGIKCSLNEMRACRNISERLRISPDERLAKLVEEMDIVDGLDDLIPTLLTSPPEPVDDPDLDPPCYDDITDDDLQRYDEMVLRRRKDGGTMDVDMSSMDRFDGSALSMDIDGYDDDDTHDHSVESTQKSDVSDHDNMSTLLCPPYNQCYPTNMSTKGIVDVASATTNPLVTHTYQGPLSSSIAVKSEYGGITPPANPTPVVNPYTKQGAVQGPSSSSVTPVINQGKAEEVNEYDIAGVTDAELIHATDHATSAKSGDAAHQVALAAARGDASVQSIHSSGSASGEAYLEEEHRETFRSSPIFYTVQEAFMCGATTAHKPLSSNRKKTFQFVYPKLTCHCVHTGDHMIEVGDEAYLHSIQNSTLWWDQEFVTAFSIMAAHYAHSYEGRDTSIVLPHLVNIITARDVVHESVCKNIDPSVERVVGVIHQVNHYAVMDINIKTRVARIYDGLQARALGTWTQHVVNALQMCNLTSMAGVTDTVPDPPSENPHPRTRHVRTQVLGYTLIINHEEWRLEYGQFIAQTDGFNCGPIACLKLLEMYNLVSVEDVQVSYATRSIRALAIEKWRRFVDYCNSDLIVRKRMMITMEEPYPLPGMAVPTYDRTTMHDNMATSNQAVASAVAASLNAAPADMDICFCAADDDGMELVRMTCCKKTIHRGCVIAWLQFSTHCMYCRRNATLIEVVGYPTIMRGTSIVPFDTPTLEARQVPSFEESPDKKKRRLGTVGPQRSLEDELKQAQTEAETPLRSSDQGREDAMMKKNSQQKKDHIKWIKQHKAATKALDVTPGAVLIMKMDSRDVSHATGIPGIAWRIGSGGGVMIATQFGIVSSGQQKDRYWLSHDKWSFHAHASEEAVLSPQLQKIRDMILNKTYIEEEHAKISIMKCHQLHVGSPSPNVKARCNCRHGECKAHSCGCVRRNARCGSTCSCKGSCIGNPHNGK